MKKNNIIKFFEDLNHEGSGFTSMFSKSSRDEIFERIKIINEEPISKVQMNQLLLLSNEAGMTYSFYEYYWLKTPEKHIYDVKKVKGFNENFVPSSAICSIEHLKWGLTRIYIDSLLYFGNINSGYRTLKDKKKDELESFFDSKQMPTEFFNLRGKPLDFNEIPKDDRYLISEMACKTYGDKPPTENELREFLFTRYKEAVKAGRKKVAIKELFDAKNFSDIDGSYEQSLPLFEFAADEILDEEVESENEISEKFEKIANKFLRIRKLALNNTDLYLSLVNDLDVYVATSMRTRKDFRDMADSCEKIFKSEKLKPLNLRYFDPTISAADGHEDKGLIECLMVKCAKVLVYVAGEKESYGKDAEAAMALSLGKPVIFFCNHQQRVDFYKRVHPLSRLIDFETGVAVGAFVTESIEEVAELLSRIFENRMEYDVTQEKPGYYKLKERLTKSVVRLQTNNQLLTKSFWTYYKSQAKLTP
jgi:hypothetical protein